MCLVNPFESTNIYIFFKNKISYFGESIRIHKSFDESDLKEGEGEEDPPSGDTAKLDEGQKAVDDYMLEQNNIWKNDVELGNGKDHPKIKYDIDKLDYTKITDAPLYKWECGYCEYKHICRKSNKEVKWSWMIIIM